MSKALKAALIISFLVVLFDGAVSVAGGFFDSSTVCLLSAGFVILTIFLWISFTLGIAMYKGEKKVWDWINEEEK